MGRAFRRLVVLGLFSACLAAFAQSQSWVMVQFREPVTRNLVAALEKNLNAAPVVDGVPFRFQVQPPLQHEWQGKILVVEVRGSCRVPIEEAPSAPGALGWVTIVDGEWMPFIYVDCQRLAAAVRRSLHGNDGRGECLVGRAMALVIRHELHHLIRKTREHDETLEFSRSLRL